MTTRAEVVAEARRWLGTPFRAQASAHGTGCDCAGLVVGVARALGLVPADFSLGAYSQQPHAFGMTTRCEAYMTPIVLAAMQPGDVVEMRFAREPQHLAILADYSGGRLAVIHALTGRAVVEHRLDSVWRARIVGAYALPGVA